MIAGNGVDMGTTSIIAFPLAIKLAYFCLIDVVSLFNLLAAIKINGDTADHVQEQRYHQIN
jgi:hypothetical protein